MLILAILGAAEQALRLVNTLLADVPPGLRAAQAMVWFRFWWPLGKIILQANGTPAAVIEQIETLAGAEKPNV